MPEYLKAAEKIEAAARGMENRTHDTEKQQRYEPGRAPLSDSGFVSVRPDDKVDQGEAMRRGMQGGAEIPRDEDGAEGVRAHDPVEAAANPLVRPRDVRPDAK